jgi:hypothetical protein
MQPQTEHNMVIDFVTIKLSRQNTNVYESSCLLATFELTALVWNDAKSPLLYCR